MFEGLSRRIALRFLSSEKEDRMTYYTNNAKIIASTVFKDSFYLLRFVDLMLDHIIKCNDLMLYQMSTRYRNLVGTRTWMDTMKEAGDDMARFVEDVKKDAVRKLMTRYGFYSPNIEFLMVMGILAHMLRDENEESNAYRQFRSFVNSYPTTDAQTFFADIKWMREDDKTILRDELQVWNNLHTKHKKKST